MARLLRRFRAIWILLVLAGLAGTPSSFAQPANPVSLETPSETAAVLSARSPRNAEDLRLIQDQLQRVIKQAMPATVAVEIRGAAGSGVIVNREGLVLTAAHVVGRAGRRAWVELPDGRRLAGRSLGANHDVDAGMIKIDNPPTDLPFAPVHEGPELEPGEWVVTIGQPGGVMEDRAPPVRFGRVLFRGEGVLCTDCKLVGGDSGGPLFNMNGEVVGIHSSIGPMLTHNFHVPISAFHSGWDRLVKGEVWGGRFDDEHRALLGVRGHTEEGRCVITQVFPGMPADKVGMEEGDVILAVENREIGGFEELSRIVAHKEPGDRLRLKIERDGEIFELSAELVGTD
ncbi:MAG TPA: trypsin-like peptidase domain-containing protein [Lacipirellula sp.]